MNIFSLLKNIAPLAGIIGNSLVKSSMETNLAYTVNRLELSRCPRCGVLHSYADKKICSICGERLYRAIGAR